MKYLLIFFLLIYVVACTPIESSPIPPITNNIALATKTSATLLTATITPTKLALNPSETILVSYYQSGTDGSPGSPDDCLLWIWRYKLIIYADGHLIMHTKQGLFEKLLTAQEISDLLQQIEATGFFKLSIKTDAMGRYLIYNTPIPQSGEGGSSRTFTIRDQLISIYDPLDDYVIAPVKNAERIIRDYEPTGMKRYIPKELWLGVSDVTGKDINNLTFPIMVKPEPTIVSWSAETPNLAKLANLHKIVTLQDNEISPLLSMFPNFPAVRLFSENGKQYIVVACPIALELK